MKFACCSELFFVLVLAAVSWTLMFIFMFQSPRSKYNFLERDFSQYQKKSVEMEASAMRARDDLKKWKKENLIRLGLMDNETTLFSRLETAEWKPVCLAVMTKNRVGSQVNYFSQTVMSILTRTNYKYANRILLRAFNMEEKPSDHEHVADFGSLIKIVNMSTQVKHWNARVKEALDFALVLGELHRLKCNYSILIEDDAIISYNWYDRIESSLQNLKQKQFESQCWLYLKLFTGYKFFDWDWITEPYPVLRVLALASCIFFVEYFVFKYFNSKRKSFYFFLVFLLAANSLGLSVFFNATSVTPVSYGIHEYATGFGTVALLVPHENLLNISKYIETRVNGYLSYRTGDFQPKDIMIDEYRNKTACRELILEPSLFQHVGMHSSLYLRDLTSDGYFKMRKSFSFKDERRLITFDPDFFLS
jgi:hypothetical protein